jgi:hypothetical protein
LREYGIEVFDLDLETGAREAKENDAGVGKSLLEDKLAEIAVGNDENALFFSCDFKDILIGKTGREVAGDDLNSCPS